MKRLAIITVGKTHSGKTSFARELEKKLDNSLVIDQDNQAEFINTFYKPLLPMQGPNTLKTSLSKTIVNYAIENSDLHLIVCNSNRSIKDRSYLLENYYHKDKFIRILVHFDIPDHILQARVTNSQRSTTIFRVATTFEEVLLRQQKKEVVDPVEGEADLLFVIKESGDVDSVIQQIVNLVN